MNGYSKQCYQREHSSSEIKTIKIIEETGLVKFARAGAEYETPGFRMKYLQSFCKVTVMQP